MLPGFSIWNLRRVHCTGLLLALATGQGWPRNAHKYATSKPLVIYKPFSVIPSSNTSVHRLECDVTWNLMKSYTSSVVLKVIVYSENMSQNDPKWSQVWCCWHGFVNENRSGAFENHFPDLYLLSSFSAILKYIARKVAPNSRKIGSWCQKSHSWQAAMDLLVSRVNFFQRARNETLHSNRPKWEKSRKFTTMLKSYVVATNYSKPPQHCIIITYSPDGPRKLNGLSAEMRHGLSLTTSIKLSAALKYAHKMSRANSFKRLHLSSIAGRSCSVLGTES